MAASAPVARQDTLFDVKDAALDLMAATIKRIICGEVLLPVAHEFLLSNLAPYMAVALSHDVSIDKQEKLYVFSQTVIKLCVVFLAHPEPLNPTIQQQLVRIFLGDGRCYQFFAMKRLGIFGTAPEAVKYVGDTAKFPASGASMYFIGNMNFFGRIGGYEVLARRIDSSTGFQMPIEELMALVKAVIQLPFRLYTEKFAKEVFPRLFRAVLNRLLRMTTEELRAHPRESVVKDIITPMKEVHNALRLPAGGYGGGFHNYGEVLERPAMELLEEWDTVMSLRQLRCEPLGIRFSGLQVLVDNIQAVRRKEGRLPTTVTEWSARAYRNVRTTLPTSAFWTGPSMAKWLKRAEVLPALLGYARDGDLRGIITHRATPAEEEPDRPLREFVKLVDPEASPYMKGELTEETPNASGETSGGAAGGGGAIERSALTATLPSSSPLTFAGSGKTLRTRPAMIEVVPIVAQLLIEESQMTAEDLMILWETYLGALPGEVDIEVALSTATKQVFAWLPTALGSMIRPMLHRSLGTITNQSHRQQCLLVISSLSSSVIARGDGSAGGVGGGEEGGDGSPGSSTSAGEADGREALVRQLREQRFELDMARATIESMRAAMPPIEVGPPPAAGPPASAPGGRAAELQRLLPQEDRLIAKLAGSQPPTMHRSLVALADELMDAGATTGAEGEEYTAVKGQRAKTVLDSIEPARDEATEVSRAVACLYGSPGAGVTGASDDRPAAADAVADDQPEEADSHALPHWVLGKGQFGTVAMCKLQSRSTGEHEGEATTEAASGSASRPARTTAAALDRCLALKLLPNWGQSSASNRARYESEYLTLSRLPPHRNVVRMLGLMQSTPPDWVWNECYLPFEKEAGSRMVRLGEEAPVQEAVDPAAARFPALFMVVEWFPITLEGWRAGIRGRLLPWPLLKLAARDIAEGLWHLHWHGVVHRDLKLDNVMVDEPAVRAAVASAASSDGTASAGSSDVADTVGGLPPRFVLIDLGVSFQGSVDSPGEPYMPPALALAPGSKEPARSVEVSQVLDETMYAEVNMAGGNTMHLAPEVRNGWGAALAALRGTPTERRRVMRNATIPYGKQSVFALGVLLFELATGGRDPIPDYSSLPGATTAEQVPEYVDAAAAGSDWGQGGRGSGTGGGSAGAASGGGGAAGGGGGAAAQGPAGYPAWFVGLIRAMLRWDPKRRPSLFEVRRSLWREAAWEG